MVDTENTKYVVAEIMGLAVKLRHALAEDYDSAYKVLQDTLYATMSKTDLVRISTDHGPWITSTVHKEETYCSRCLLRSVFLGARPCSPHLEVTRDQTTT